MTIKIPESCNNSPKKERLAKFNIAFAKGNLDEILQFMDDNCTMTMVIDAGGSKVYEGKQAIKEFLLPYSGKAADHLEINQIITHGKEAAVRGFMKMGEHKMEFADFIEFNSAGSDKIKKIFSYTN